MILTLFCFGKTTGNKKEEKEQDPLSLLLFKKRMGREKPGKTPGYAISLAYRSLYVGLKIRFSPPIYSSKRKLKNPLSLYKDVYHKRDIPIVTVMSDDAKKRYRTINPCGIGYTDHYNRVLSSQNSVMKLTGGNPTREIDFLEIS